MRSSDCKSEQDSYFGAQLAATGAASTLAFFASSLAEGVAFRLGAAAGFFVVVSALGFGAALGFSSAGFAAVSGFAFATFGEVAFLAGFAAAAAFLTVVFALVAAALTAAVDDFVASRGERRVGPVAAFLAGMATIEGYERGFRSGD